jgi:large subunit ribosomal protein L28
MARICTLTGKKPLSGHKVSHSNVKTKRKFYPNIHTKNFFVPEVGEFIRLKVSTTALRNINKKGIYSYLRELEAKGEIILSF